MPKKSTDPHADWPLIPGVELEREIATGSYATVYGGRQISPERPVAVKVLLQRSGTDEERSSARFEREGELLSALKHPGIVEYYGSGVTERGRAYLLMELVDGPNLRDHIDSNGPMSPDAVISLGKRVAEALRHAHNQGIMHRDVKAENILLNRIEGATPDEIAFEPKLADLGLARPDDNDISTGITLRGAIVGTPSIMAPEQFQDVGDVDYRVDIYALGCVMYFAMTGEAPFGRGSLPEMAFRKVHLPAPLAAKVNPKIPTAVSDFLAQLMQANRESRPQTYDEVIAFLSSTESTEPDLAVREGEVPAHLDVETEGEAQPSDPIVEGREETRGGVGCLVPFLLALTGGAGYVVSHL